MYEPESQNEEAETSSNPDFDENSIIKREDSILEKNVTQPKERYTEATLLDMMHSLHIGTSATQANLISELLKPRGNNKVAYVNKRGKKFYPTDFGIKYISCVPDNLKSVEFLSEIENSLILIESGDLDRNSFLDTYESEIHLLVTELKNTSTISIKGRK